jgi:histidinol dehydrogenase
MRLLHASDPAIDAALSEFEQFTSSGRAISDSVAAIIDAVRCGGDEALCECTARYDGVRMDASQLRVSAQEMDLALASLSADEVAQIERAKSQIAAYHRRTLPQDWEATNGDGATVGEQFFPIESVGLYVPGGTVPLVSSVLMSSVLAKIAGNPRVVIVTPPLKDGSICPAMLAAIRICGVDEVYKVGGAQAIAALAYGTATIPAVDKVFGPGNAYVLEAKRQVFGKVGIDLLPGPSEVAIVADESAQPEWVAADLLAQAEHGSGKERILLLATSVELLNRIEAAVEAQLPQCSHEAAIRKVMHERCLRILFKTWDEAIRVLNRFAPEHLELQVEAEGIDLLRRKVTTAGAFLIGHFSPAVLGDFTAGPSHTLPTGGAGRFMSGMRLSDFFRRTSVVRYDRESLSHAAPVVRTFSRLEQLDAHGRSLDIRIS